MEIITTYPCKSVNYSNRQSGIKYIVIHYVGATGSAKENAQYYSREYVGNSAHFFVGHASENADVYSSVPTDKRAWHCGTENGVYKHPFCRNDNSIGIEMCCHYDKKKGWYFDKETVDKTIELTKILMKKYNVPIGNVLRHYDVTGKSCPAPFVNDSSAWDDFKRRLVDVEFVELTEPNDIVWELSHRGIVTDAQGMLSEMNEDRDGRLYWLARKCVNYIRGIE